ncbi:GNAT family N-acetyltransferase [Paracoccus tegillarcae]|uniref:N-acetyltransferase n=1 Tax=Paracoccus tegillarcae TaxID=1529068 RepID=A0A2K9EIL9_9RHOB|nr:GNAT family N-acetyltransferase [Paracoccus tegillarcae]AUH34833.1 N-acetyltransferase [Paracoccus tegillarcae]
MSVSIRPLGPDDREQWQEMYDGYQTFYKRPGLPADFFAEVFQRLLNDDPAEFHGLVAAEGGRLLGLTHYVFHPNIRIPTGTCYLQDLFTRPEARGKGVARALIGAVYSAADAAGVPDVYWLTAEDNYRGRMLYDRVGVKTAFIRYNRA